MLFLYNNRLAERGLVVAMTMILTLELRLATVVQDLAVIVLHLRIAVVVVIVLDLRAAVIQGLHMTLHQDIISLLQVLLRPD